MTRWLRFLIAWFTAKRRPALGPTGEVVQRTRAWLTECDAAFMNHAAVLVLCEMDGDDDPGRAVRGCGVPPRPPANLTRATGSESRCPPANAGLRFGPAVR
jgi:hypothetical protein